MKFKSLNDRGGNSIYVLDIVGEEEGTIYVGNEFENTLAIEKLSLASYNHYIKPVYNGAPDFDDENQMMEFVINEAKNEKEY